MPFEVHENRSEFTRCRKKYSFVDMSIFKNFNNIQKFLQPWRCPYCQTVWTITLSGDTTIIPICFKDLQVHFEYCAVTFL